MAKIRVYELARDLNMTNKELLEKLIELGISVNSHMSALEDEDLNKIRADLQGAESKDVEIKRVQPTVIRRRKKRAAEEAEEAEEAETAVGSEAGVAEDKEAAEKEVPDSVLEVQPVVEETPQPEPQVQPSVSVPEKEQAPPAEPLESIRKAMVESGTETTQKPEAVPAEPLPATVAVEEEKIEPPAVPARQPKTKKKTRKDMPAKIISLPEQVEEKPAPQEVETIVPLKALDKAVLPEPREPEPVEAKEKEPLEDKKKKKGKIKADVVKVEEEIRDKKVIKKKAAFRKKEIIEGADLYDETPRGRKARKGARPKPVSQGTQITTPKAIKRRVKIDDSIILADLGKRMGIKAGEMIKKLMMMGVMATVNQTIDFDTAALVAAEFGYEVERASFEEETLMRVEQDDPSKLMFRPPVVTIMGHVDHGKTSLLDAIRKTRVTEDEAGGITQHIGAYNVTTEKGQIVFLDTPGHEAFTAMRSRGAQITDIVVLVVAADDGVMPQTLEAINHAKAAGVSIIVAVNKIDKPGADPDRVLRQLSEVGLTSEEWGGDTIFVRVSAKKKLGINELLDMILLQAEIMELKANPYKLASGHVVEAKIDAGRGPVATVLVEEGTLRVGDPVVCGIHSGKIRAMIGDRGGLVESAGPSIPVEIIGLSGVPMAGDDFVALNDEKNARQISLHRTQKLRSQELAKTSRLSLEKLYERMQEGKIKDLNIIIKADVHGSIEALSDSLIKLSNEEVQIHVIHSATGTISESDVSLAAVSNAIIIGFNVRPSSKIQDMAAEEHVDMRFYNIIYNVIKDVKDAIVGMMASTFEERMTGKATVRDVFHVPKVGAVAGCYVTEGKLERGRNVRLIRDGIVQFEGKIGSLRRFKDDVKEVAAGYECGVGIENYNDIKVDDVMECFYMEEIKPEFE